MTVRLKSNSTIARVGRLTHLCGTEEIERLDSSYNGNCTRIWITCEEPKEHSKEPRWKVEVDVVENEWVETPAGNNDRVVKEGDSILAILDQMLTDLKERMLVEDVEKL